MTSQTLLWTTLPAGIRRIDGEWRARISVFLTPRLDVPPDGDQTLEAFPAFVDWPATLRASSPEGPGFTVQVSDGRSLVAENTVRLPSADHSEDGPESVAWRSIFPTATPVRAFAKPEGVQGKTGMRLQTYPAGGVIEEIRNAYNGALAHQLGLAKPPSLAAFAVKQGALKGTASTTPLKQFFQFTRPGETGDKRYRSGPPEKCADFHQIVASLGTHPRLLRRLGLVLDLELPAKRLGLDPANRELRLAVQPVGLDRADTHHVSYWTMVEYDTAAAEAFRVFTARHEDRRPWAGFHALGGRRTAIAQEQLEHAAFTLMQHTENVLKDDAPLPALLQGGMRLTQSGIPRALETALQGQSQLEQSLTRRLSGPRPRILQASFDEPPLNADQLTRGYRVDVHEVDKGRWRSLCRRKVRYHCDGWAWPSADGELEDEGVIEPTAHVDEHAARTTLRATEDLVEWDGWSLVVPRPDHAAGQHDPASGCQAPLKTDIAVAPGSLQPQRFGRCYQFRARAVDLAGNSLTAAEADALAPALPMEQIATAPVCYLRVESAKPPVLFRAQPRGPGEGGDVIVIRDADSWSNRTIESRVHVLPPEVSLRMAEKHGIFDALSPSEAWRLIRDHRGSLAFDNAQDQQEQNDDERERDRPVIREPSLAREIYTPYLPDPMVRQAVLVLPDGAGHVDMPAFDDLPQGSQGRKLARSCSLVVRAGGKSFKARAAGRQVTLEVPRGRVQTIRIAAKLGTADLSLAAFANPDWQAGSTPLKQQADLQPKLAAAAARGEMPLLAPARTVRVVHATQRPLSDPQFGRPLILPRAPNATTARLADDALSFDRPSTGRIDVYARWEDPVDEPRPSGSKGWGTARSEIYAGGVPIEEEDGKPLDPAAVDRPGRSPLSHDFGDTKHHEVAYQAVAASRFIDFYPAALTDDPANVTRPSRPVTLHVPSTAPPVPPDIAYVVPTLQRNVPAPDADAPRGERHAEQIGAGLRVYMNRGWFSSGQGEQLALVVAVPGTTEPLLQDVSSWGLNPLHDSAPLPGPLQLEHIWGGAERFNAWPLEGGSVGLVVYDVRFSEVHQMPFADIVFLSQKAFMPMVRLALARYQQHAIEDCNLSPIVQADFVPLAPGRTVTVTQTGPASWGLAMRGDSYKDPRHTTSVVQAYIEVVEKSLPEDTALWRPVGEPVILRPSSVEAWRYHWTGQVRIADPEFLSSHWRRRLVIQEFEPFDHNGPQDVSLADRSRLISAHAVPL
jgi:hypothetical protein